MKAPTSEWKIVWTIVLLTLTASCWVYVFMRNNVFDAMLPKTITRDHVTATVSISLCSNVYTVYIIYSVVYTVYIIYYVVYTVYIIYSVVYTVYNILCCI